MRPRSASSGSDSTVAERQSRASRSGDRGPKSRRLAEEGLGLWTRRRSATRTPSPRTAAVLALWNVERDPRPVLLPAALERRRGSPIADRNGSRRRDDSSAASSKVSLRDSRDRRAIDRLCERLAASCMTPRAAKRRASLPLPLRLPLFLPFLFLPGRCSRCSRLRLDLRDGPRLLDQGGAAGPPPLPARRAAPAASPRRLASASRSPLSPRAATRSIRGDAFACRVSGRVPPLASAVVREPRSWRGRTADGVRGAAGAGRRRNDSGEDAARPTATLADRTPPIGDRRDLVGRGSGGALRAPFGSLAIDRSTVARGPDVRTDARNVSATPRIGGCVACERRRALHRAFHRG